MGHHSPKPGANPLPSTSQARRDKGLDVEGAERLGRCSRPSRSFEVGAETRSPSSALLPTFWGRVPRVPLLK